MSGKRFQDEAPGSLKLGQRVRHAKFGDGVVLNLEGQGTNARVQVNFERQGTKWLMMGYANLQRSESGTRYRFLLESRYRVPILVGGRQSP